MRWAGHAALTEKLRYCYKIFSNIKLCNCTVHIQLPQHVVPCWCTDTCSTRLHTLTLKSGGYWYRTLQKILERYQL